MSHAPASVALADDGGRAANGATLANRQSRFAPERRSFDLVQEPMSDDSDDVPANMHHLIHASNRYRDDGIPILIRRVDDDVDSEGGEGCPPRVALIPPLSPTADGSVDSPPLDYVPVSVRPLSSISDQARDAFSNLLPLSIDSSRVPIRENLSHQTSNNSTTVDLLRLSSLEYETPLVSHSPLNTSLQNLPSIRNPASGVIPEYAGRQHTVSQGQEDGRYSPSSVNSAHLASPVESNAVVYQSSSSEVIQDPGSVVESGYNIVQAVTAAPPTPESPPSFHQPVIEPNVLPPVLADPIGASGANGEVVEARRETPVVVFEHALASSSTFDQDRFDEAEFLLSELSCPICHNIPRPKDAVKLKKCIDDHQSFCRSCIMSWINRGGRSSCPLCRTECVAADVIAAPKVVANIIERLKTKCINVVHGCPVTTTFGAIEEHEEHCPQRRLKCVHCELVDVVAVIEAHMNGACDRRPVVCPVEKCGQTVPYSSLEEHQKGPMCGGSLISCPHECSSSLIPRCDMREHLQACPLFPVFCPVGDVGCSWTGYRQDIPSHLHHCWYYQGHNVLRRLKQSSSELNSTITEQGREIFILAQNLRQLHDLMTSRQSMNLAGGTPIMVSTGDHVGIGPVVPFVHNMGPPGGAGGAGAGVIRNGNLTMSLNAGPNGPSGPSAPSHGVQTSMPSNFLSFPAPQPSNVQISQPRHGRSWMDALAYMRQTRERDRERRERDDGGGQGRDSNGMNGLVEAFPNGIGPGIIHHHHFSSRPAETMEQPRMGGDQLQNRTNTNQAPPFGDRGHRSEGRRSHRGNGLHDFNRAISRPVSYIRRSSNGGGDGDVAVRAGSLYDADLWNGVESAWQGNARQGTNTGQDGTRNGAAAQNAEPRNNNG